ncbi:MAG: rhodanese-like domain-containing protein, partial [Planctomycetota bacterium]|nr:rhodanese-like domain-containing protein [Planctomycetota bacterium]
HPSRPTFKAVVNHTDNAREKVMKTITAEQLKQKIQSNPALPVVNVLDENHFRKRHIPGSTNVPLDQDDFTGKIAGLTPSKDAEIVVYCASESCDASPKAAKKLESAGFQNIVDFEGGMDEWAKKGFEVESGA